LYRRLGFASPSGRASSRASTRRPVASTGKAISQSATAQNLSAIGTGKEPMSQNIIGNLLSRGKHGGASDLGARLLESWGQNVIVHHLGGRSPPKRPGPRETLKLGPSPRGQGRERIVARTPPKTPKQRKDRYSAAQVYKVGLQGT